MTRIEALTILQNPKPVPESVRAAYRAAALKYHPDRGGDLRQMQLVNIAYDLLRNIINVHGTWGQWHYDKAAKTEPLTETIKRAYNKISHLPGIEIELCGTWLWVSGKTRAVKNELKAAGFKSVSYTHLTLPTKRIV